jgi:hypothetical protein
MLGQRHVGLGTAPAVAANHQALRVYIGLRAQVLARGGYVSHHHAVVRILVHAEPVHRQRDVARLSELVGRLAIAGG